MVVVWCLMELSIFVRLIVSLYPGPATSDAITHLGAIMMLAPGWSSSPVLCRGIAQTEMSGLISVLVCVPCCWFSPALSHTPSSSALQSASLSSPSQISRLSGFAQNPPQSTPSSSWSWISLLHSPAAEGRLAVLPQLASAAADMAKERRNSEMIIAKETSNPAFVFPKPNTPHALCRAFPSCGMFGMAHLLILCPLILGKISKCWQNLYSYWNFLSFHSFGVRRLQKESGDVSHPGIDGRDLALVEALKQNAKASLAQLSALTGMPRNTVHNRIKRLERSGVIQSYTARVDYKKLGQSITAFVLLDIDYGVHYDLVEKLRVMPFVHRIFSITGRNDLVLMIRARNPDELARFVLKEIRIRGVSKTETLLVLEELK